MPMQILYIILLLTVALLFAIEDASGEATIHRYQNDPLSVDVGKCVNFTARSYYSVIERPTPTVRITWKKDTHVISNKRAWLYFSYANLSDAAFYQVEIHNTESNIIEETKFWLSVEACKPNEMESPQATDKCQSSCIEACPPGWRYLADRANKKCYKYFSDPKTWSAARDACEAIDSELVVIENKEENRFVGSLVQSAIGAWIGLNDRDSESQYIWNDGESSAGEYRSWRDGEPNNYNANCNIENCVIMSKENGKWVDIVCNGNYPYVCEAPFTNMSGWSCLNSKCYRYFDQSLIWSDAKASCKAVGSTLLRITSQAENEFVWRMIKYDIWIGLNDIAEAGSFVWNDVMYSAATLPFTNWAANEPNDMMFSSAPGKKCAGEDCVALVDWQSVVSWLDFDCNKKVPFICEKKSGSLLPLGAIVGIVIGSLIAVVVFAGIFGAVLRKRICEPRHYLRKPKS